MSSIREITDGVHWIYGTHDIGNGRSVHSGMYVVDVDGHYLLINSGDFDMRDEFREEIDAVTGGESIEAIFTQESHMPNSANVNAFRKKYDADVIFPGGAAPIHGFPEVIQWPQYGEETWNGRKFQLTRGTLLDLPHTTWIFDTETQVLFTCEGFCYYHVPEEADCLSSELSDGIAYEDVKAYYDEMLLWLEYADPEKVIGDLRSIVEGYDIRMIAPSHGNPIVREDIPDYMSHLKRTVREIADSYEYNTSVS